jgi:hypothetical protein
MDAQHRMRIIVLGYVVRGPLAGPTWHHLQYVLGLQDLGHDVWYLEDSTDDPFCYDPARGVTDIDPRYGLDYVARVFGRAGVGDRWAYFDAHDARGPCWLGPAADRMPALCASADLMINVSGINPMRPWLERIPRRAFIDTDPVFTQVDILQDAQRRRFAEAHNMFFSFAESIGQPGCTVPDDGIPWQPTRQPVVMRAWRPAPGRVDGPYTTVMLWDSYDRRTWGGRLFGMKAEEMERVLTLPSRCSARFELAVGSPTTPNERLQAHGWRLRNPIEVTSDPWIYQDYMHASKAEFSVAKHGYVVSASGWFSERSAGYLACGRPVIVQDTGFSRHLPTGDGLLAFTNLDEAVAAVAEVDSRYAHHCRAARALVEAHFDARDVLTRLLDAASAIHLPTATAGDDPA